HQRKRAPHSSIYLAGWSAGAHLAAMALGDPEVAGGLCVSGIYDLEPVRLSSINQTLGLSREDALRESPIHRIPSSSPPLLTAVGGGELPEFKRQAHAYFAARQSRALAGDLVELPSMHHYAMLDQFADEHSPLLARLRALASLRT